MMRSLGKNMQVIFVLNNLHFSVTVGVHTQPSVQAELLKRELSVHDICTAEHSLCFLQ